MTVQAPDFVMSKIKNSLNIKGDSSFCLAFAPGRLEVLGNHTDYNAGLVLTVAIEEKTWLGGFKRNDQKIILNALDLDEVVEFNLKDKPTQFEKGHWANYLIGVIQCLLPNHDLTNGFEVSFLSEVPMAAGCSSSAALTVGFLSFLEKLFELNLTKEYKAKLCQKAENEYAGVQCGLMDQWSVVHGEKNGLIFFDNRSLETKILKLPAKDIAIVIFNTCIKHTLVNSHYNTRRAECNAAVDAANQVGIKAKNLRELSSDILISNKSIFKDNEFRRALHVVGENERIEKFIGLNESERLTSIREMMFDSHKSSRDLFENSCPELDCIVSLCELDMHCMGAKLSGGGFGGCVVALVKEAFVDDFISKVETQYVKEMIDSPALKVYKTSIGVGAGSVDLK